MSISKPVPFLFLIIIAFACHEKKERPAPIDNVPVDTTATTQSQPLPPVNGSAYVSVDISPMDMSYFPVDYPKLKMASSTIAPPVARVIYSRPHLQKRHLFHDLLKYDEPWRLGANEATEIDFYKQVTIQGKNVSPGRYVIYCIPHADNWSIVLNSNIDSWGLHQDSTKDIHKFEIPVTTNNPVQEYYTMLFEKTDTGASLMIAWDAVVAKLPITF
jgi:hypothetical protein